MNPPQCLQAICCSLAKKATVCGEDRLHAGQATGSWITLASSSAMSSDLEAHSDPFLTKQRMGGQRIH
jgi:hypothetical protein